MTNKIIIRDGIIRQGRLEFRVKKLILDNAGRIVRVEGKELCPECMGYISEDKYCSDCNYKK